MGMDRVKGECVGDGVKGCEGRGERKGGEGVEIQEKGEVR